MHLLPVHVLVLIILSWVVGSIQTKQATTQAVQYCVNPTTKTNATLQNDDTCLAVPLNYFVKHETKFFANQSNISMKFLDGVHNLTEGTLTIGDLAQIEFFSSSDHEKAVTIIVGSGCGIIVRNVSTSVIFRGLTFVSNSKNGTIEFSDIHWLSHFHTVFNVSQSILISNTKNIELYDSTYENSSLQISHKVDFRQSKKTRVVSVYAVNITSCVLNKTKVTVSFQEQTTASLILKDSKIIGQKSNDHGFELSSLAQSNVDLNVINCSISNSITGVRINAYQTQLTVNVQNTTVTEIDSSGLYIEMAGETGLANVITVSENSSFISNKNAISIMTSSESFLTATLHNCTLRENVQHGFYLTSKQISQAKIELSISNCNVSNSGGSGIGFEIVGDVPEAVTTSIVDTDIRNCTIGLNMSQYYGREEKQTSLTIQRCTISENNSTAVRLFAQQEHSEGFIEVLLDNSTIMGNRYEGFIVHKSKQVKVNARLQNSVFKDNYGVSMLIDDTDNEESPSILTMNSVLFRGNSDSNQQLPTIQLSGYIVANVDDCQFELNVGTPIQMSFGEIYLSGNVTFINNRGFRGGGLSLIYSQMYLVENSAITFRENEAVFGGAIFVVKTPSPHSSVACFYQLSSNLLLENTSVLNFEHNRAERGGNEIYGAALNDTCFANTDSKNTSMSVYNTYFNFNQSIPSLSRVSSDPIRVCLCDKSGKPRCSSLEYIFHNLTGFPGEEFSIPVVVVGDEFGTVSGTVYANIIGPPGKNQHLLDTQTSQTVNYTRCTKLTYTVYAPNNSTVILALAAKQSNVQKYGNKDQVQQALDTYNQSNVVTDVLLTSTVFISIKMLDCPPGFEFKHNQNRSSCICSKIIKNSGITICIIRNEKRLFYRTGTQWVGRKNETDPKSAVLVTEHTPFGHCNSSHITLVDLDYPDSQCINNHTGIMCGRCKDSLMLGGSAQCSNQCENSNLALIVVFIVAGFALILFIKVLDLTVTNGTINGLIFYANVVWANQHIIFPANGSFDFLKIFIAWINLDFGIDVCFFTGFNAIWSAWLQFVFPLYVWTIAGLVIIVSHCSTTATRLFGTNTIDVLATLFLLSYTKLLRSIIITFDFTYLESSNYGKLLVWTEDGSVSVDSFETESSQAYLGLVIVSLIFLLFFSLPVTLTLLFIQPLRKVSNLPPFKWVTSLRLKPFIDAYTGLLNDKHQYWIGLLLLVRCLILLVSVLTPGKRDSLLAMAIVTAALSLQLNVYKNEYLFILEKSFVINLTALASSLLYIDLYNPDKRSSEAVTYTFVGIAFVQFICIVVYHIYCRVKKKDIIPQRKSPPKEKSKEDADDEKEREPLLVSRNSPDTY